MDSNRVFRDLAVDNLRVAKALREQMKTSLPDEQFLNYIAYHIQQALEIWVKSDLEDNGIEYSKTHDIEQLIILGKENNMNFNLSPYIIEHSEMFTNWESKTRCVVNYKVQDYKVDNAIKELEKIMLNYYKVNSLENIK